MAGLSYYMHDGPKAFRFQLSGSLTGVDASRLDQAWRTASSTTGGKILAVDVTSLASIDENGRDLLLRWYRAGAHYIANSTASRSLVESITGHPYLVSDPATRLVIDPHFIASAFRTAGLLLILAMTLLFPSTASAANDAAAVLEGYTARLSSAGPETPAVAVEIDALLLRSGRHARVEAIRRVRGDKHEYKFVSAEGDSVVRNEVIARYLAIDAASLSVDVTQSNYKFHFVRTKGTSCVFRITPRRKRPGTIAGELWIDTESGLVTHMSGRLVKMPSVLLRRVHISQKAEINDGETWSRDTRLHIDTRFTGRAELTIRERVYGAGEVT